MARTVLSELAIELGLDTKELRAGLMEAQRSVKTNVGRMKASFDGLKRTLGPLKGVVAGAFSVYAVKNFIEASNQQERAVTDLTASLQKEGIYSDALMVKLQKHASYLQKVANEADEVTLSNIALMENIGHLSAEQLPRATEAAIGLSRIMKVDTKTAFMLLGRAAAGNTELFTRYGIQLDKTLSPQEKFNKLLEMGAKGFEIAKAQTKDQAGQMKQLGLQISDIKEKIGDFIKVAIQPMVGFLTKVTTGLNELSPAGKKFVGVLTGIAGGVGLTAKAFAMLNISMGPIGWAITAIIAAATAFYGAWKTNVWGIQDKTIAVLKTIKAYLIAFWETVKAVGKNVPLAFKNAFNLVISYFRVLWTVIKDFAGRFGKIMGGIGTILKGIFTLDAGKIKAGFSEVASAIKDDWGKTFEAIKDSAVNLEPLPGIREAWARAGKEAGEAWVAARDEEAAKAAPEPPPKPKTEEKEERKILTKEEKIEIEKRIAELRIANIEDEFARRRAETEAWAAEEVKKAKGNATLIELINQQKSIRLQKIEEDALEATRERYGSQYEEYIALLKRELSAAETTAERKKAIRKQLVLAEIELEAQKQEAFKAQQEKYSYYIQGALQNYGDQFANMLEGQEVNWSEAYEGMARYFIRNFVNRIIEGISDTVAAWVLGEEAKQAASSKTALISIASAGKTIAANLKAAASAIYHAIASGMKWLVEKLGPVGLAAGMALGAGIVAAMLKFKKVIGLAKGGKVSRESLALLAEEEPEVVAPETEFIRYSREILRREVPVVLDVTAAIKESLRDVTVGVRAMVGQVRMMTIAPEMAAPALGHAAPEISAAAERARAEGKLTGTGEVHYHFPLTFELHNAVVDDREMWEQLVKEKISPALDRTLRSNL